MAGETTTVSIAAALNERQDRVAEPDQWAEFQEQFLLRRVALGECHRPYGTPCVHEHACTRCRFLRVDPAQLGRIEQMTENAEARLVEAEEKTWLGTRERPRRRREVSALEESRGTCGCAATKPSDGSPTHRYWPHCRPPMEH